jgi:hypothetical protein
MFERLTAAVAILAIPALADSGLFYQIRDKDTITLVLPNGECGAKMVSRNLDQLTLRLERNTDPCGERKSLVVLSRLDVRDVLNTKQHQNESQAGLCAAAAMALAGAPIAEAIGEMTRSDPAAILVLLKSQVSFVYGPPVKYPPKSTSPSK